MRYRDNDVKYIYNMYIVMYMYVYITVYVLYSVYGYRDGWRSGEGF